MKYMLLVYLDETALSETEREHCYVESAQLAQDLSASGKYLSAGPLHPVATATSVRVRNGKRLVTDGPFAETRELIAGFWIWKVNSMDEAVEWVKRIPFDEASTPSDAAPIEIRQVFEMEDFGAELTPEARAQEERLRGEIDKQQS